MTAVRALLLFRRRKLIRSILTLKGNYESPIKFCATFSTRSQAKNGIIQSDYEPVILPNQDICSLLFSRWEKWPEKEAYECLTTGQKLTYADLRDASLRWGGVLNRLVPDFPTSSVPPTVAIFAPNVIEYGPVIFGTLAAGWSLATINSNYKIGEIIHSLKTTEPKILVVDPTLEDLAAKALLKLKMDVPIIIIGPSKTGKPNLQELLQDPKAEKSHVKQVSADCTALILQSSGTTGLPKSVAIPHKSVTNNLVSFTDKRLYAYGGEEYPHVTVLGMLPFYHSFGMYGITLTNLYLGSKILVIRNFDPHLFGNIIKSYKIRCLHLVPTLMNFIIHSPHVTSEHLATVRGIIIKSAPVLPTSANAFRQKSSPDVLFQEGYGMTEILCATLTPKDSIRIGFCGKLAPNMEAKILDLETGVPLGPDERGEILLRGPSLMSHYIKNPRATAETIDEEGWLHTGDVAKYNTDGYFSIVDRIKDLIKVKGFQVSPAEIEDVLMEHPAVAEVGVVGVPDERVGERPRAYITLKGKATEDELIRFVEDRLSSFKWLIGGVQFLDDLPKSQTGKILRKDLKILMLEDGKK